MASKEPLVVSVSLRESGWLVVVKPFGGPYLLSLNRLGFRPRRLLAVELGRPRECDASNGR